MPNIGPMEIVLLLGLALLLFGAKRLPEIGRSMGKGMREFKDSVSGIGNDDHLDPPTQLDPPLSETARTVKVELIPGEHDAV